MKYEDQTGTFKTLSSLQDIETLLISDKDEVENDNVVVVGKHPLLRGIPIIVSQETSKWRKKAAEVEQRVRERNQQRRDVLMRKVDCVEKRLKGNRKGRDINHNSLQQSTAKKSINEENESLTSENLHKTAEHFPEVAQKRENLEETSHKNDSCTDSNFHKDNSLKHSHIDTTLNNLGKADNSNIGKNNTRDYSHSQNNEHHTSTIFPDISNPPIHQSLQQKQQTMQQFQPFIQSSQQLQQLSPQQLHTSTTIPQQIEDQMKQLHHLQCQQKQLDQWYVDMHKRLEQQKVELTQRYDNLRLSNIKEQQRIVDTSQEFLKKSLSSPGTPQHKKEHFQQPHTTPRSQTLKQGGEDGKEEEGGGKQDEQEIYDENYHEHMRQQHHEVNQLSLQHHEFKQLSQQHHEVNQLSLQHHEVDQLSQQHQQLQCEEQLEAKFANQDKNNSINGVNKKLTYENTTPIDGSVEDFMSEGEKEREYNGKPPSNFNPDVQNYVLPSSTQNIFSRSIPLLHKFPHQNVKPRPFEEKSTNVDQNRSLPTSELNAHSILSSPKIESHSTSTNHVSLPIYNEQPNSLLSAFKENNGIISESMDNIQSQNISVNRTPDGKQIKSSNFQQIRSSYSKNPKSNISQDYSHAGLVKHVSMSQQDMNEPPNQNLKNEANNMERDLQFTQSGLQNHILQPPTEHSAYEDVYTPNRRLIESVASQEQIKKSGDELLSQHYNMVDNKFRRKSQSIKFFHSPGIACNAGNHNKRPLSIDNLIPEMNSPLSIDTSMKPSYFSVEPTSALTPEHFKHTLATPENTLNKSNQVGRTSTSTPNEHVNVQLVEYYLSPVFVGEAPIREVPQTQPKDSLVISKALLLGLYKGFVTRKLIKCPKVQELVQTMKDTSLFLENMNKENEHGGRKSMSHADQQLRDRLLDELSTKYQKLHDIFVEMTTADQMKMIIMARHQESVRMERTSKDVSTSSKTRALSSASQKSIKRRAEHQNGKTHKKSTKSLPKTSTPLPKLTTLLPKSNKSSQQPPTKKIQVKSAIIIESKSTKNVPHTKQEKSVDARALKPIQSSPPTFTRRALTGRNVLKKTLESKQMTPNKRYSTTPS